MKQCSTEDCERAAEARGMCHRHYNVWWRANHGQQTRRPGRNIKDNPTYKMYWSIKMRCYEASQTTYRNHGGRGIKMADRWLGKGGYENFVADMGPRPAFSTIQRHDDTKDYSPENCYWVLRRKVLREAMAISKSGIRGVVFRPDRNKWIATISINHKRRHLGAYVTKEEAAAARQRAEVAYIEKGDLR